MKVEIGKTLPEITEAFKTAAPHMGKFARMLAEALSWLAENPWKGLGLVVAGSLTKDLASAGIGALVGSSIVGSIATAGIGALVGAAIVAAMQGDSERNDRIDTAAGLAAEAQRVLNEGGPGAAIKAQKLMDRAHHARQRPEDMGVWDTVTDGTSRLWDDTKQLFGSETTTSDRADVQSETFGRIDDQIKQRMQEEVNGIADEMGKLAKAVAAATGTVTASTDGSGKPKHSGGRTGEPIATRY
jgi:hypothetical protein